MSQMEVIFLQEALDQLNRITTILSDEIEGNTGNVVRCVNLINSAREEIKNLQSIVSEGESK